MKESASSPLELYEKAYILQYDEGKTSEACRLYKAIIDEFPESNECGYSVIQLEKILAKNVSDRIVVSSKNAYGAFNYCCRGCNLLPGFGTYRRKHLRQDRKHSNGYALSC
jgi:hypothetical protein